MYCSANFRCSEIVTNYNVCLIKTSGGILLPEAAVGKASEGEVLAIGPGLRTREDGEFIPVGVSVGDKVLLPEYGGLQIKLDGEDLFLFRNDEILAKFTK